LDRRRIELQIRAVLVAFRGERRRRDHRVMNEMRRRSHALLDEVETHLVRHPDLQQSLMDARAELDRGTVTMSGEVSEESCG
jgi:uncharacterized protein (DUF2461 family)